MKQYLVIVALLAITTLSSQAQILYTLTDPTDNIDFTYESSTFITADEGPVSATTSDSNYNILYFEPKISEPASSGSGFVTVDRLSADDTLGQDAIYTFSSDSFDTLGTYTSPNTQAENLGLSATLTVTEVPEPSTWALAVIGLGAAAFFARRRLIQIGR